MPVVHRDAVLIAAVMLTLASAPQFVWPLDSYHEFGARLGIYGAGKQGEIMLWKKKSSQLPSVEDALPGRAEILQTSGEHFVNGNPIKPPFPEHLECAILAMGCFWGAERVAWLTAGVYSTAVGYISGLTPNPTYEEVCSGRTGHTEAILVVFDPSEIGYAELLKIFWESHDPTQGMRQGNDMGTQYRSGIYFYNNSQHELAESSKVEYESRLKEVGLGPITTEILQATEFYYAEDYHQQYLAKNPSGYCGIGGVGVKL